MEQYITWDEIIYIMIISVFITWLINNFLRFRRLTSQDNMPPGTSPRDARMHRDIQKVMERCYNMFPVSAFRFKGHVFSRGMQIRITTKQNKVYTGELIGINSRNLICIITPTIVVAHEISNIVDISPVETENEVHTQD